MNFDDPRITAYALGELESAEDRRAVEELLREHPELSNEVEETRAFGELLRQKLPAEDAQPLTPVQREHVLAATMPSMSHGNTAASHARTQEKITQIPLWRRHWVPSAIAATVVLTTSIASVWKLQQPQFRAVGISTEAATGDRQQLARSTSKKDATRSVAQQLAPDPTAPAGETAGEDMFKRLEVARKPAPAPLTRSLVEGVPADSSRGLAAKDLQVAPMIINPSAAPSESKGIKLQSATPLPSSATASLPRTMSGRMGGVSRSPGTDAIEYSDQGTSSHQPVRLAEVSRSRAETVAGAKVALPYYRGRGIPDEAPAEASLGRAKVASQDWASQPGAVRNFLYSTTDELRFNEPGLPQGEPSDTESYDSITDNAFLNVSDNPLSTFSIDVDTASYSNVRRFLTNNQRPPRGAVRIEELVNYFPYSYPQPEGEDPFSCTMEVAPCPWKPEHRLVRVGLKGREIAKEKLPPSNLVFLIDVSGSMTSANKLPLVKECMEQLTKELREQDTVGIVVYAGSSGVLLEPTSDKAAVRAAIEGLRSGGSTNGAAGIRDAYNLAQRAFKKDGNNRVILASDGDFNVGVTSQSELIELIQEKAKGGVFLSVLGFGMGNMKDSTMEKLADKGNGNYAYIDSLKEGRKVLVEQMAGTLFTIAKDVKIQVEFNPAQAGAYRLIGYENRILAKEDFNDDKKDAGEIGAGHTVTALYEVVPAGQPSPVTTSVDPLKYGKPRITLVPTLQAEAESEKSKAGPELLTLKLRFKQPTGDKSTAREFPLNDAGQNLEKSSSDFRWASAVAGFGMLLRDSPHRGNATWESVTELATGSKGEDPGGYRTEFIELIDAAKRLVPVTPLAGAGTLNTGNAGAGKAASIVVPEFDVSDLPVLDAIDQLSKRSRDLDPEKKGVSLVFAGPSNAAQTKITLRMRDTTVLETANAIASTLGLELQEQGDILILRAKQ